MLSSGRWLSYLIAFGLVVVTTLIGKLLQNIAIFDPIAMSMLYILSTVISAAYLGSGPSIMISFLSVLAFDFFFIPPVLTLVVANEQHSVTLLIMFIVTFTISCLSPRIRR